VVTDSWEQHIERVKNLMKAFADPCDGTIYHYTSLDGFQGIIESSELRLTNTGFVNDTTECRALREEAKNGLLSDDDLKSNRYVKKWWALFQKDKKKDNDYYIASFSKNKNPDSLEQWRAYGRFCVGFDAQKLRLNNFELYECVYDKEEIKKWILEKSNEKDWQLNEPDRNKEYTAEDGAKVTEHLDARDSAAFGLIFKASIKFKNKHYENEKEVRLLAISHSKWDFPNSPGMYENDPPIHFRFHPAYKLPVPYIKFFVPKQADETDSPDDYEGKTEHQIKQEKLLKENSQKRDLLPITKVWIGPGPHKDETRLACEILLQEKGYKDVQIEESEIPYRGF
jgi:hypothetical protein